jgi:hypothetical protein
LNFGRFAGALRANARQTIKPGAFILAYYTGNLQAASMTSDITQFIVDKPSEDVSVSTASPTPQQFYPETPTAPVSYQPVRLVAATTETQTRLPFTVVALIILLIILIIVVLHRLLSPEWKKRGLAGALADREWILYTRPGCGYCTKQMDVLGGGYSKRVVCVSGASTAAGSMSELEGPLKCKEVSGFPTWVNARTGKVKTGLRDRAELDAMLL